MQVFQNPCDIRDDNMFASLIRSISISAIRYIILADEHVLEEDQQDDMIEGSEPISGWHL